MVDIRVPKTDKALAANGFSFHLRCDRLRRVGGPRHHLPASLLQEFILKTVIQTAQT